MLYSFDHQHLTETRPLAPTEPTDEELMGRIQQGDETALALLHRRHHALLRTIIGRMLSNDHDVDDLVQEVLLEIWRRAANYDRKKGYALGWIVTLARRRTIDRIRRRSAYNRAQERFREETDDGVVETHSGADEEAAQSDTAETIARFISVLPEAQQEAVRLAFYRGMSQREIAAHTGIPLGTIKTRLELAMRKLRAAILAFGELRPAAQMAHA
jgi:RNA polymerase sigma-70 factor (ECF subfamily)